VLRILLDRRIVSYSDLLTALWPGDLRCRAEQLASLYNAIRRLRRAVNCTGRKPWFVKNVRSLPQGSGLMLLPEVRRQE
jgi:DNA-binding winged helix-turn-helix (wHTH) protein